MRNLTIGSAVLCAAGLLCSPADGAIISFRSGVDLIDSGSHIDDLEFFISNGRVSIYARNRVENRSFACSMWYTNQAFPSFKETALAFVNTPYRDYGVTYVGVAYDSTGACTDLLFHAVY